LIPRKTLQRPHIVDCIDLPPISPNREYNLKRSFEKQAQMKAKLEEVLGFLLENTHLVEHTLCLAR
jgi:hypothetical protein